MFCRWVALATALGKVPDLPVEAPEGYGETLPDALRGRLPVLLRLRALWERLPAQPGLGGLSRAQLEQALYDWLCERPQGGLDGKPLGPIWNGAGHS